MTTRESRPGAHDAEATARTSQSAPKRKRLPRHRRAYRKLRSAPAGGHERNQPVDWAALLSMEPPAADWLLYPFVERGQHSSLYSESKAGKSLLVFDMLRRACKGSQLDGSQTRPIRALYLDYENPEEDLQLRAHALQATASDLEGLVYIQFPDLPPLDSKEGGAELSALVEQHDVDLVVIDTISRAVDGLENESSTWNRLYQYTLIPLKQHGIASLRLDHSGKTPESGARGSSAKSADVDAVWSMKYNKAKCERSLRRTHTRRGRGPDEVQLRVDENPLQHVHQRSTHGGEDEVERLSRELDRLGVAPDAGRPTAAKALREAGLKAGNATLEKVVAARKGTLEVS